VKSAASTEKQPEPSGLRAGAPRSDDERTAWLEEMLEIAYAAGAVPKRRDAWGRALTPDEE
jgi:hypothetical protein